MHDAGDARSVRILFISAALNVGGAERQWAVLVPLLRSRGFKASVVTLLGRGAFFDELSVGGTTIEYADLKGRFDVAGLCRLVATERTVDLVVSQSLAGQVVGHMIALRCSVPHVTTEHLGPRLPRRPHERAILRALAPHFDTTVAVTYAQTENLASVGYPASRVRVIPNGVAQFSPVRGGQHVRMEFGLGKDTFVAVLAATLRPLKRAHLFVDAVVRANHADSRIRGLVVGDGPDLRQIEQIAHASHGVVQAIGQRTDVVDILAMADAVCLSSAAEALPMVILEAMSLAKPVVATNVGGVPEAVAHEETGLLVPSGDADALAQALVRLTREPHFASALGRAAERRWSERFTAERMADRYATLFESIARGSSRRDNGQQAARVAELPTSRAVV
jgi:glycosyltransferase involved in cell wall biosynthesis